MPCIASPYFSKEPGDQITKHNGFVCFIIARWRWNTGCGPQITLPLIQPPIPRSRVDEKDSGSTLNQPPPVHDLNPTLLH